MYALMLHVSYLDTTWVNRWNLADPMLCYSTQASARKVTTPLEHEVPRVRRIWGRRVLPIRTIEKYEYSQKTLSGSLRFGCKLFNLQPNHRGSQHKYLRNAWIHFGAESGVIIYIILSFEKYWNILNINLFFVFVLSPRAVPVIFRPAC